MQYDLALINQELQDLNPLIFGWETCEKKHSFGPASREYYLIHFIVSGKGFFESRGKVYQLSRNWMFLIRPHEITYYEADEQEPWYYIWIGFNGRKAPALIDSSNAFPDKEVLYSPQCEPIFKSMLEAIDMANGSEFYLCGKLYEMFSRLCQANYADKRGNSIARYAARAEDYIKSNYVNEMSVESIAALLQIDRRYLCRIFKAYTGKSPQQYIVDLRLKKATQLMLVYDYSPGEAAKSTGYTDTFNFSRMFKKYYGLSPLNYKKCHNEKPPER